MNIRKITAFLLAFLLFFSFTASADAALSEQQIFELKAFSIIQGGENGDLRLEDNITRAEFTKIVCKLLNFSDEGAQAYSDISFKDVASNHWAVSFISIAASLRLIDGDGTGNFNPEDNITYDQVAKILVTALGYGEEAIKAGGYPGGYLLYANKLGLLKGVSFGGVTVIKRNAAFRMVYNCLDADRLVELSYGYESKIGLADKSLRDILLNDDTQNLIEFKGTVTANYKTYLADPIPNMKTNEVEIGGRVFDKGNTNADEYLGMEVDVFIAKESEDSDNYIIKEIKPTSNNTAISILFKDIESINKNEINYYAGDSENVVKKNLEIAQYVYNGRLISDISDVDISSMLDGNITLIFDQEKNKIRYVFINEYESFTVDRVTASGEDDVNIFFANNKTLKGQRNILLGEENDVTYEIYDADNKPATFEAVKKGDLISIFYSLDNELAKIMISRKVSEGVLSSISYDDNEIEVDDTDYYYEKNLDLSKFMGKNITAMINFEGKVSYIDLLNDTLSYAGIVEIKQTEKISNPYEILLVIPDLLSDEVEELDTENEYADNEIPAISGKNIKTLVLNLADRVSYNGSSFSDSEAVAQIQEQMTLNNAGFLTVSYKLDSNGNIKKIELPEMYKQGNDRTYNAYEKTFSDGKYNQNSPTVFGAFGLGGKTLAICVPDNGDKGVVMDDYLAKVEMNNGQDYYVEAYDFNKATKCPDLVLIHAPMVYKSAGITDGKSKVAIVNKVSNILNEENEQVKKIQLLTQDGEKEALVSDNTTSTADFDSLRVGDLIRYSLNSHDELDGFDVMQSTLPVPDTYYSNSNSDKVIFVGNITNVSYDEVSPGLNKWVHLVKIEDDYGNMVEYQLSKKSGPPIFIFDSSKKTARLGTADDLVLTQKRAVIYSSGLLRGVTNVKAVVIII